VSALALPVIQRGVPAALSLALHALVVVLLTANWASRTESQITPQVKPRAIKARLVDAETLRPKKKPAPKAVAKPAPKPVKKVVSRPRPAPTKAVTKPKSTAQPKPRPVRVEQPRPSAAELAAAAQLELSSAMDAEDVELEASSDLELTQSYVALIASVIEENWSRPPSARNGMETELALQLIPTGEVVSVAVIRSSGELAFDRSAVNAVQKAERFPELQNLPGRVFESNFRRLRIKFKPEDLRY
jgi:TonB family protein